MRNAPARRHQGVDTASRERLATVIQLGRLRGPPAGAGPSAIPCPLHWHTGGQATTTDGLWLRPNSRGIPARRQIRPGLAGMTAPGEVLVAEKTCRARTESR